MWEEQTHLVLRTHTGKELHKARCHAHRRRHKPLSRDRRHGHLPFDIARTSLAVDMQKYITLNISVKLFMSICYTSLAKQDKRILHCTTLTPATNSNLTGMHSAFTTFIAAQHNHSLPDPFTSHRRMTHKSTLTRVSLPRPHPLVAVTPHYHISVL